MSDDERPLFRQVTEHLESAILAGTLAEHAQVPSTNELAAFHRINPATALKGVSALVADGILYKKRGIGMFVSAGAPALLRQRRRAEFARQYVEPLVAEARRLGIHPDELTSLVQSVAVRA